MNETTDLKMRGEIIDKIYDKEGNLIEERKGENLVVTSFLTLIACLMKNEQLYSGIQYWAIGQGNSSWDEVLPSPTLGDTQLVSEIGRVALDPSDITYVDENFDESPIPTNILQIQHTFDENTLNGSWREFGIFGGNATSALGSGIMINHRNHALLVKTSEMVVQRTMRFTLTLA